MFKDQQDHLETYFKELTNNDVREQMFKDQQDQLEQDI